MFNLTVLFWLVLVSLCFVYLLDLFVVVSIVADVIAWNVMHADDNGIEFYLEFCKEKEKIMKWLQKQTQLELS